MGRVHVNLYTLSYMCTKAYIYVQEGDFCLETRYVIYQAQPRSTQTTTEPSNSDLLNVSSVYRKEDASQEEVVVTLHVVHMRRYINLMDLPHP